MQSNHTTLLTTAILECNLVSERKINKEIKKNECFKSFLEMILKKLNIYKSKLHYLTLLRPPLLSTSQKTNSEMISIIISVFFDPAGRPMVCDEHICSKTKSNKLDHMTYDPFIFNI